MEFETVQTAKESDLSPYNSFGDINLQFLDAEGYAITDDMDFSRMLPASDSEWDKLRYALLQSVGFRVKIDFESDEKQPTEDYLKEVMERAEGVEIVGMGI